MIIDFHTHRPTAEGVFTPRSFGIHPWKADEVNAKDYNQFIDIYGCRLEEAEIIGECGLDKACSVAWDRQMELAQWHVQAAVEMHKPMVIHCVKAFNELVELRKRALELARQRGDSLPLPWVVHGFTGTVQTADQLYRHGILVSYGATLLDARRTKVRTSLEQNEHPFMLETDDNPCGIQAVYEAAAEIKKTTTQELCEAIKGNYLALFG